MDYKLIQNMKMDDNMTDLWLSEVFPCETISPSTPMDFFNFYHYLKYNMYIVHFYFHFFVGVLKAMPVFCRFLPRYYNCL